jgi:hypothetical protein
MLTLASALTLALAPTLYPSRTLLCVLGGISGVVVAIAVASSWLALACMVCVVAVMVLAGASVAPTDPEYLDRGIDADDVLPAETAAPIRFLPPVYDTVSDVEAELDRLLAMYDRAVKSRHKARAAQYWARYCEALSQAQAQAQA